MTNKLGLDIFIKGELMDLCIPTEEFALTSEWYSLFNNPQTTRYLEQGSFPNTKEQQAEFFQQNKSKRLILIISNKTRYVGVISLSEINFEKRKCDVAQVVDNSKYIEMMPYLSLEAMARISEHAFTSMGMKRIEAGQHVGLAGWQQRIELLGFKVEGLHSKRFVKGREEADSVSIACNYDYYEKISRSRGSFWDSYEAMKNRVSKLPKKKFINSLAEFYEKEADVYYEKIFSL